MDFNHHTTNIGIKDHIIMSYKLSKMTEKCLIIFQTSLFQFSNTTIFQFGVVALWNSRKSFKLSHRFNFLYILVTSTS